MIFNENGAIISNDETVCRDIDPIDITQISSVENEFKIKIPNNVKKFFLKNNGGKPYIDVINTNGRDWDIRCFLSFNPNNRYYSIQKCLPFFLEESKGKMIPIAVDNGGNYYCIDSAGKVYNWFHEEENSYTLITKSFDEFVKCLKNRSVFNVVPLKSVNGVPFGMDRIKVRKAFGKYSEFMKTKHSENTTDIFGNAHVFYTADNKFEAIEIFQGEVNMNGKRIFPAEISSLKSLFPNLKKDGSYYIDECNSIGVYVPNNKMESILFGCQGYYTKHNK